MDYTVYHNVERISELQKAAERVCLCSQKLMEDVAAMRQALKYDLAFQLLEKRKMSALSICRKKGFIEALCFPFSHRHMS